MAVQYGTAATAWGDYRNDGQIAVHNRTERGRVKLSILNHHRSVDCTLSAAEARALRDHLSALLEEGRV